MEPVICVQKQRKGESIGQKQKEKKNFVSKNAIKFGLKDESFVTRNQVYANKQKKMRDLESKNYQN